MASAPLLARRRRLAMPCAGVQRAVVHNHARDIVGAARGIGRIAEPAGEKQAKRH
jgi:hypothetical protein